MRTPLDRFEAAFNKLTLFFAALVAISIGLIAVLIPLNLFLVKAHLGSIWWLFEGVEYALYFGVFLGAPWVLQQGAHVQADILTSALPKRAAARLDRILDGAGFALCTLLSFYGLRAFLSEYQEGTMPDKDLRIANWIVLSGFAVSFLLLAIEFLLRMRSERVLTASEKTAVGESGF